MAERLTTREEYKFVDTWLGRFRYTISTGYYDERIMEKSILVNGVDGRKPGEVKQLRRYNILKRWSAMGAILEKEMCPALVDEDGKFRVYFED